MTSKEAWETMIVEKREQIQKLNDELTTLIYEYSRWEKDEKRRSDPGVTQEECLGEG